jgi:hypothetical protein
VAIPTTLSSPPSSDTIQVNSRLYAVSCMSHILLNFVTIRRHYTRLMCVWMPRCSGVQHTTAECRQCVVRTVASCFLSHVVILVKCKAIPLQAWTGPLGSRRLRLPEFLGNRHMKLVGLSALLSGCVYPAGDTPGTHFC